MNEEKKWNYNKNKTGKVSEEKIRINELRKEMKPNNNKTWKVSEEKIRINEWGKEMNPNYWREK